MTAEFSFDSIDFKPPIYNDRILYTPWNKDIIEWRFFKHPVFNYRFFFVGNDIIIYKTKNRFRLYEAQVVLSTITDHKVIKVFIKYLKEEGVDFISYYGLNTKFNRFFNHKVFKYKLKKKLYFVISNSSYLEKSVFRIELAELDSQ